jgi:hypothetical protein
MLQVIGEPAQGARGVLELLEDRVVCWIAESGAATLSRSALRLSRSASIAAPA